MKTGFSYSLALLVMLFSFNCAKQGTPTSSESSTYIIPLQVGNIWVSAVQYYDTTGAVYDSATDSIWISQDSTINGQRYFLMREQLKYSDGTLTAISTILARNASNGYVIKTPQGEVLLIAYPYLTNDSSVVTTNVPVDARTGTYNCIVYEHLEANWARLTIRPVTDELVVTSRTYVCPNVGIVKKETWSPLHGWLVARWSLLQLVLK